MRDDRYVSLLRGAQKGGTEKAIIFHALGNMERRGEHKNESSSSASCVVPEGQRSAENKLIREGMGKDFRQAKVRKGIPPFEAMLSPEQKKALYSGTEMPKDQKGLGYQYQVIMVTIEPPKGPPGLSKSLDKDIQAEESDETVKPTQVPLALEEGSQATQDELLEINLGTSEIAAHIYQRKYVPQRKRYVS